jgi:hypothetical protein
MRAQTFNAATKLAVSTVACTLTRVQGYYKAAADAWILIFDSPAEPAANAVPVKSYALPADSPFSWAFDPGELVLNSGCYVAVSSDEEKYTAVAYSADTTFADIEADFGPSSFVPSNCTIAGDLTTNVGTLVPWVNSAANANVRLYQLDYVNGSGAVAYLQVFAKPASDGDKPLFSSLGVANGGSISLCFGDDGLPLFSQNAIGVAAHGCYILESLTAGAYSNPGVGTSRIRAYYK